jgi:hypothetical protein
MATYSVYNIKIDNQLSFTPGATAGYVLAIDANGNTYWSAGGAGGSGSSGTSGSSGSSGTSGSSGSSGTSGKSGSSGTSGSSPAQTLAQTLALGNSVGTYSITSPTNQTLDIVSGANAGVRIGNISNGNYIGVGLGITILGATTSFNDDVILPITSSLLATDGSGRIIATSSTGGGSGSSGTSGSSGSSGTSGVNGSSGTSGVNGSSGTSPSSTFYTSTSQGATVSNTTGELITYQQLIPGGTFKTGDVIQFNSLAGWANTTYSRTLRVNGSTQSGTLGGSLTATNTRLGQGTPGASRTLGLNRVFWIYNETGAGEGTMIYPTGPNSDTGVTSASGGQPTSFVIDWTKDYYIVVGLQHANTLDSGRGSAFFINKIN